MGREREEDERGENERERGRESLLGVPVLVMYEIIVLTTGLIDSKDL